MAIAAKDRFLTMGLSIVIGSAEDFPPTQFKYEGEEYAVLGVSNKTTLIPVNVTNIELQEILTLCELTQYVCSNQIGDLFEASFYKKDGNTILFGFGTREKPEKKKKENKEA